MGENMNDDMSKTALKNAKQAPARLSRRTVLRAGVSAMPVVLTLQSGEALARSSNLIGSALGARDDNGDVLCLDTTHEDILASGKIDIGDDGVDVHVLPDTDFYLGSDGGTSGGSKTAEMACRDGGDLKTHASGGWHRATLPRGGVVVSNVALNSVSARAPVIMRRWQDLS
jgi:hypothetical protein